MDNDERNENAGVHIHLHVGTGLAETQYNHLLEELQNLKSQISTVEADLMKALDDAFVQLEQDVTDETTVEGAVLTLAQGIADQLKTATTPAQVTALSAKLQASKAQMAAWVTANTPVATGGGKLTISPTSLALAVGGSQLASAIDSTGAAAKGLSATSSDSSVATAGSDGTISGLKAGSAVITFTDASGATGTCNVTVS